MKKNQTTTEIAREIIEEFKQITEGRTIEEKKEVWDDFMERVRELERQRKTPH